MTSLEGRVALVTGAARGQGRAHALTLAGEGAAIVAVDICKQIDTLEYPLATADDLGETVALVEKAGRRAIAVQGDARSQEAMDAAVAKAVETFGRIDILIANHGIWGGLRKFWEISDEQWETMIDVNLTGVWRVAKAVAPRMIQRRSGAIVMVGSVASVEGQTEYAHYVAAKHGLVGVMRNVALELAPYGIRCNAVLPGPTDSPMVHFQEAYDLYAGEQGGSRDDLVASVKAFNPLANLGMQPPQPVADAALWLVSDAAARVTGALIPVESGHLLLPGVDISQF